MKIISLDCETNGLGGHAFCVAATLSDESGELESWTARAPIFGDVDPWVAANVLPAIEDVPIGRDTHNYWSLLRVWRDWYAPHRDDATVIAHVAWPVETTFLREAHESNLFEGPYPLVDVASVLLTKGHDPKTVDGYLDAHGLPKPPGSPHHPLYDARAAATAFRHLMGWPVAVEGRSDA